MVATMDDWLRILDPGRSIATDSLGGRVEDYGGMTTESRPQIQRTWVPRHLQRRWAKRTADRNELLNVVGECLDEFIVRPGMAEIDEPRRLPWWERWRPRQ